MAEKIKKTEEEWRKELTPEQYRILRMKGTEAPGTGEYLHEKRAVSTDAQPVVSLCLHRRQNMIQAAGGPVLQNQPLMRI